MAVCLAISTSYELLEFLAAKILGSGADKFLGMQGSLWDTQWNMTFALIGGITALLTMAKYQDKYLNK